jgi:hypothetical protein
MPGKASAEKKKKSAALHAAYRSRIERRKAMVMVKSEKAAGENHAHASGAQRANAWRELIKESLCNVDSMSYLLTCMLFSIRKSMTLHMRSWPRRV